MEVARKKGLPELKHHLLPRTRGFTFLVNNLKNTSKLLLHYHLIISLLSLSLSLSLVPAVYCITFGYRTGTPSIAGLIDRKKCTVDLMLRYMFSTHELTNWASLYNLVVYFQFWGFSLHICTCMHTTFCSLFVSILQFC